MAEKNLEIATLLDCYGALLTSKQKFLLECYYFEDLSLTEIADNEGITPQGARDIIKRAADKLLNFEKQLKFAQYIENTSTIAEKIISAAEKIENGEEIKKLAEQLII